METKKDKGKILFLLEGVSNNQKKTTSQ